MIAAELKTANGDMSLLEAMIRAAQHELDAVGVTDIPATVLADAR